MSLVVRPMCTDLISAYFNMAGSRNSLTFPLGLGTNTNCYNILIPSLHQVAYYFVFFVKSVPFILNGFCNVSAVHFTEPDRAHTLTCNENVPFKQPMPVNTSLYLLCIACFVLLFPLHVHPFLTLQ